MAETHDTAQYILARTGRRWMETQIYLIHREMGTTFHDCLKPKEASFSHQFGLPSWEIEYLYFPHQTNSQY